MKITKNEFEKYRNDNKAFPVFIEINGDELTPINIFYSLKGKKPFLLESVSTDKNSTNFSFAGCDPYMTVKGSGLNYTSECLGKAEKHKGRILDFIKDYMDISYESAGLDIPYTGGAVGYVGYEIIRQYERLPEVKDDELNLPEAYLMFYKKFLCYDHRHHKIYLIYNVMPDDSTSYEDIEKELSILETDIKAGSPSHDIDDSPNSAQISSNITKVEYCNIVEAAKEYIKAGDIFQVVLSQRFKIETPLKGFDIYRKLRSVNPSPYLFYIDYEDFEVLGSSPESLVSVSGRTVMTNPIAGSRKRGSDAKEDEALKEELLKDEKELAEHVMLVDLARNDIGKISKFGSVKLDKFMDVDMYSHIMHIVSKVSGDLREDLNCIDALISCLPVGTVSGAPKIRAMEIIDELETTKRNIYAGAFGYFSFNGNMDTCIAIRTMVLKDGSAYIQAGAGIVYDSVPEKEYAETLNKAKALRMVI